ncbi:Uncharacterized protein OBRU01_16490, partial [Operophtera brumata]
MGSQWPGMGAQLMRIPIFAAAIERVGELGCAYADGCLNTEEMILAACSRGRVSLDTKFIRGAMAAVGLGYKNCSQLCPPEIDVACHNGPESCTISGPADKLTEFIAKLTADGVFAKEVPCSNIAYHSRYIAAAVRDPKPRSDRWLSTSVPEEKWNEPGAKLCSADYLTNNLLSPVLFEETSRLVPSNAVLVEIAPHGLLQAILKRSLPEYCKNIALTKRGHVDNAVFLLDAIGQLVFLAFRKLWSVRRNCKLIYLRAPVQYLITILYIEGFTPRIQALYPIVEFPVSTGTPHLSHHVEWMHSEYWSVISYVNTSVKQSSCCDFLINLHDDEHSYLKGNVVRGKMLYPFSAALVAAWDTLAMTLGERKKNVSVQFRDVHLYSQPIMHNQRQLKLSVSLHRGNGQFHILDEFSKVASGFISTFDPEISNEASNQSNQQLKIRSEEVYQHLSSRGYGYRHEFKSIYSVNENMTEAELLWTENWNILIDSMLQLNVLKHSHSEIAQPSQIRELSINVEKHYKSFDELTDGTRVIKAKVDPLLDNTSCGGIVLRNIKFRNMVIGTPDKIALELAVASTPDNVVVNEKTKENNILFNKSMERNSLVLKVRRVGELNTLHWEELAYKSDAGLKIKVQYAGVNVADIKKAAGVIPFADDENYFGMDFSGGERVMGLVKNGAISTIVTAQPDMMWPVPAHWSLEDAATVPLAYAQAFYCLKIKNKLHRNSKVLIHGGAGALGQAAISIALAMGCQVFTTVADQSKKRLLKKLFPQLRAHMGTAVDTSLLQGREEYVYGMSYMTKSRSFMAVDFNSLFDSKCSEDMKILRTLVSEGIAGGYVRPLSRVTYGADDAPRAFRLLAASRHRGRVLLRLSEAQPQAQSRYFTVVSIDKNIGARACLSRLDDHVPATALSLPDLKKLNEEHHLMIDDSTWNQLAVDVIERALSCNHPILTVKPQLLQQSSLLQQLVHIGDELDLKDSYLSIVPGMEGHHERFRSMCASLKLPAVVLQPGLDFLNETPKELALRYSKVLLKKLGVKDSFYLLGYECGVTVALELAAILEEHGKDVLISSSKTGTVFCIGDGPEDIKAQVEEQLADFLTEEALQAGIIAHMFGLMSVEDTELIKSVIKSSSSWEQRVEACLSALLGRVSHSAQYVRAVLEAAYARINTARTYHSLPHKLQSKIVLMRTKSSFTLSNDVTLQHFSEQPVDVHELATPLAYATKDLRCASIINRYLPDDLLKTYENCNLCIPYAVDN